MAKLPGAYEYMATVGAPAINFGRGLLGYQDPFMTQTMQDRMTEIEAGRTKGNVGYDEYGLVPSAGRFTGGLMDLAINRPADFGLAGSIGKYDFGPEGRKGLEYNFTPDQDTGSTGSAMLDFINRGGVKGAFSRMGTAQASDLPGIPSNSLERDFPGMSTGDIIESMNNRPQNLGFIEEAPQVKGMSYEQMVDLGLMGPDQDVGMTAEDLQNRPSFFGNIQNKIGSGLGSLKEFAMNKGTQGFNLGKMALSGIGNAIMPGLGFALSNLKGEPLFRETLANSRKANPLGTRGVGPNGVQLDGVSDFGGFTTDDLGRITNNGLNYNTPEGIMSGYNAGFDLASSALGRIGTIQNAIEKGRFKDKFALDRANKKIDNLKTAAVASAQAKRQAYQDEIDRAKNEAAANKARAKSISEGYGGHDNSPGATGPTAAGAGMGVGGGYASDYGFKKDGGMIGYKNGGLASMFTRRG